MVPRPHQVAGADWALTTMRTYGLAYLIWKERTGKTLTALLAFEKSEAVRTVLIITKKKAINGWMDTLAKWPHKTVFKVINYENAYKKVRGKNGKIVYTLRYKPDQYDAIILDEAHHAISSTGRPSITWRVIKRYTEGKAILYLSATPYAEHVGLLYHQLALSDWTPFKQYKTFFTWYAAYGIPNMVLVNDRLMDKRDKYETEAVLQVVDHLFSFKTREEVGIEYEPETQLVGVSLHEETIQLMEEWATMKYIEIAGEDLLADSDMKARMVHYQLEGGTLKIDDKNSVFLKHHEKVDYIKENYNAKQTAIMAHFIKERELLQKEIPEAIILSADGDAEGVDLSHIEKLLVYSMSFKTSKHTQRVARQANHNRDTPIMVDILVSLAPAIGKAVYDSVAIKEENFIKTSYERAIK